VSVLLWLYPRAWRRQFGAEMEAVLHQMRGRRRVELALDLVRGAADAHLHPQWPCRRRLRRLAVVPGLLIGALASQAVAAAVGAARQPLAAGLLAGLWLLVAFAWRWLGSRTLFLFSALVAARFAVDWILLVPGLHLAHLDAQSLPYRVGAGILEVALGGAVAVLVLRRARLAWPAAFAAGCLLEVALGGAGLSLGVLLERWLPAAAVEPLRVVMWAAGLAWLARRRRPRPWNEPPEGAPVAARPSPRGPEPLSARARRAG
jgi:hypothetical protein